MTQIRTRSPSGATPQPGRNKEHAEGKGRGEKLVRPSNIYHRRVFDWDTIGAARRRRERDSRHVRDRSHGPNQVLADEPVDDGNSSLLFF